MKIRLQHLWETLLASYWFLPSLMLIAAAAMAKVLLENDRQFDMDGDSWRWLYGGGAEGARSVLSAVAGSVITVAGVVFSITIVTLTQASSQFGPRMLRNFMRDTGNQIVLGTFVATFIYCLLVLRAVYGEDNGGFVPNVAITFGVMLAVASIAVLIYFIHHVSQSIQAPMIVANVGHELEEAVNRLYPDELGYDESAEPSPPDADLKHFEDAHPILPRHAGYVQAVDADGLMDQAKKHDLRIRLLLRPGHFAFTDGPLMEVSPRRCVTDEVRENLRRTFIIGSARTPEQDVEFTIHQLVEIAVRALSPGINDPFTAVNCVDWLGQALMTLSGRKFPSPYRRDDQGQLRVIANATDFAGVADAAFNQVRQYGAGSVAVTLRLLETIEKLAVSARTDAQRKVLLRHAEMIAQPDGDHGFTDPRDRGDLRQRVDRAVSAIRQNGRAANPRT